MCSSVSGNFSTGGKIFVASLGLASLAVGISILVGHYFGQGNLLSQTFPLTAGWAFAGGSALILLVLACLQKKEEVIEEQPKTVLQPTSRPNHYPKSLREQNTSLCSYSLIENTPAYKAVKEDLMKGRIPLTQFEKRAIAVMYGMAIGDSVGCPYEFMDYKIEGQSEPLSEFRLLEGQWSDDTSMGLCLADSLLSNQGLDGKQLMWSFLDWWCCGYNTPFIKEPRTSIGLGGNISQSFIQFLSISPKREDSGPFATTAGDKNTSGNGSLMRNGPIALFAKDYNNAMQLSWEQSKTTHQGDEAAAACQLMTHFIYRALHNETADINQKKDELFQSLSTFQTPIANVASIAKSETTGNEDWNWKKNDFGFNPKRLNSQPGYIGSYALDALSMALYCIYTTSTFEEAINKATKRGGDADSMGAITGQMAAALYGLENIPKNHIDHIQRWDRGGEIATRALLLSRMS